jgi:asparagine synthase (glutamine-hydrolysing)
MCGIAGLWVRGWLVAGEALAPTAAAMAERLHHRGPDGAGCWADPEAGIALAHRRLAVVELSSAGAQPMHSLCGRYVIVFNGEIYNHAELRAGLAAAGDADWPGHSDTRVLLELIARRGLEPALKACIGAFAFALWDRRERRLMLARDRLGEKPLYYGWCGGRVVFASELKALRAVPGFSRDLDPAVLSLYLRYNQVPSPHSILQDIYKVPPGCIVTLDAAALGQPPTVAPSPGAGNDNDGDNGNDRGVACRAYWSLGEVAVRPATMPVPADGDSVSQLEALLLDAVRLQLVADVPVGMFLSGGIDSSLITALACRASSARLKTFTIGFANAGFDEAPYARAVAAHLGTEHTELYLDADDVLATIPSLADIYDEPFADSSQLPTILVSRLARASVTVALSGDAGDELFCGYNRYLVSRRSWSMLRTMPAPLRRSIASTVGLVSPAGWDRIGGRLAGGRVPMLGAKAAKMRQMLQGSLTVRDIYRAASEEWRGELPLRGQAGLASAIDRAQVGRASAEEQMMQWDMTTYLPDDILVKVDRAAMANSLEVRIPFLDPRVIEAAWALPMSLKKRNGQGKWILREILGRHVPDTLVDRPKAGFAVPVGQWLRGPLREWAEELLSPSVLAAVPALDPAPIRARWAQHLAGTHDWTGSIWGVLMLQAWMQRWRAPC